MVLGIGTSTTQPQHNLLTDSAEQTRPLEEEMTAGQVRQMTGGEGAGIGDPYWVGVVSKLEDWA